MRASNHWQAVARLRNLMNGFDRTNGDVPPEDFGIRRFESDALNTIRRN